MRKIPDARRLRRRDAGVLAVRRGAVDEGNVADGSLSSVVRALLGCLVAINSLSPPQ